MKAFYLRQRFWIWCLKYLLKKHSHQSQVSSENRKTIDTYWIYYRSASSPITITEEDQPIENASDTTTKYYVEPIEKTSDQLTARQVRKDQGDPEKRQFKIEPATFYDVVFEIRHFFRETETNFKSPVSAFFWRFFRLQWIALILNRLLGRWYYREVKLVNDRATVLRSVIKQEDESSVYISLRTVVNDIYGEKYKRIHPAQSFKVNRTTHRVLESLVHSGELARENSRFKTTAKCLASLSEWETDLRRHRHQKIREILMLLATVVIAIGTLLQSTK